MLDKIRYLFVCKAIDKLKKSKHLTASQKDKLSELYAEQCTYEIMVERGLKWKR